MSETIISQLVSQATKLSIPGASVDNKTSSWPNPELSIGQYIGKIKKDFCWAATGPARTAFNAVAPKIKEYLDNTFEPITSWVSWSIYMVGRCPEHASPIIIFCCDVAAHRKEVRNAIKDSKLLAAYPGIRTGHMPRPPDFNQLVELGNDSPPNGPGCIDAGVVATWRRNPCGMKVFVGGSQATVGGVIELDDKFYYTTAAHVFRLQKPAFVAAETSRSDEDEIDLDGDAPDDTCIEQDKESEPRGESCEASSMTPTSIPETQLNESRCTGTEACSLQNGREPAFSDGLHRGPTLNLSGPGAVANVDRLRNLGPVSLTSLNGPDSGLDYGLIEASDFRHLSTNRIDCPDGAPGKQIRILQVDSAGAKDALVYCATSRGVITGSLCGTPTYVRAPSALEFKEAFTVALESPLEVGDCGSWIVDRDTGNLYGHVVAGSPECGKAIIVPFHSIFEDISKQTNNCPRLPIKSAPQAENTDFTDCPLEPTSHPMQSYCHFTS